MGRAHRRFPSLGAVSLVVVGCLTVVDPLVAVVLGTTMLGEGAGASTGGVIGLVGLAALAVSAALLLARSHPAAQPVGRA